LARYAANALAFWQGSQIIKRDGSAGSAGTIYAIVFLILDASFVIGQAGPFIQSFSAAASAGRRIFSLIDYPDVPIDVYSNRGVKADDDTFGPDKDITFQNVSFSYPARPLEKVLDSINIQIKTGSTVGIVGASGSGKSTIAALLLRLYDPSHGYISIDSHLLPEYQLSSLRHQIALVDQDPAVFSGTIYTNIKDGFKAKPLPEDEMRERCMHAAKAADAWAFIEALPNGLDTTLGEPAGTKLSGGQRQRLCLARALVGDPSLLVLDEATSALDTISEASVLNSLGKARSLGNRTTVMIAHRLASVRSADNIIVMGKGRILEQGDHDTLMSNTDGAYRKLIEAQRFLPDEASDSDISETKTITNEEGLITEEKVAIQPSFVANIEEERKPLGTFTVLRRCIALGRSRIFFVCLALLGSLTTGALIIGESIIFGHLVSLLNGPVASDKVNFYCLMFFVVSLAALGGYITSGTCFGVVSEHLIQRTRDVSLRTILRQDMEWFLQPGRSTSSLVSLISMDSGHLSGLSGVIIGTVVSALVAVIGGAVLAHIVAWKIAIVLFATSPVIVLSGFYRLRVLAKLEEKNQLAYIEAASLAAEACSSIRTIAALGTERATSRKFRLAVDKYREQTFRQTALGNFILAFALAIT
jgi:ATP-binding cassette, subfamily B (MDR/TAP), member 1